MRPVIEQIDSFDATSGKSIKFYYGGNQSYGSLLKVYTASNLSTPVYTNRVINMNYTNAIASGVLTNGVQYVAEIISYDNNGVASEASNKTYFWCFATPVFKFTNITDGDILDNQSFTVSLLYEQANGVDVSQFRYELYDYQMTLLSASDYYSDYYEHASYNYNGLENNQRYYIRAYGFTTRSQKLDTGYLSVFILFEDPDAYSVLYANADNGNGVIEYNTNIRLIEPNRDNNTYTYQNDTIDLTNDKLVYDTNFVIDGDFVMAVRHKYTTGKILTCSNLNKGFNLEVIQCPNDLFRYKLSVPNEICNYILYSLPFTMNGDNLITCWIRRKNNLYELVVFTGQDTSEEYNLFLGTIRPYSDVMRYDVWIDTNKTPTVRIEKENVVIWKQLEEPENADVGNIWIDIEGET